MSGIVVVGDVHIDDRPPGWRTESYCDDVMEKLEWVRDYATEHECDVMFTGDLFHRKRGVSYALLVRLLEFFARWERTPWIVVGNHDVVHDRVDLVGESPLGVLDAAGVVRTVSAPGTVDVGGRSVGCVPYAPHVSAGQVCDVARGTALCVVHYGLTPSAMPFETIDTSCAEQDPTDCPIIVAGHIHDDLGVWQWGSTRIFSVGALTRGSWTADNRTRTPRVTVIPDDAEPFTKEVPVRPAEDVFHVADVQSEREHSLEVAEFVADMTHSTEHYARMSAEEVKAAIRSRDVTEPVMDRACTAVDETWEG